MLPKIRPIPVVNRSTGSRFAGSVIVFCLILGLASWLFFDVLFLNKTIIHGDSIVHGLSVLDYHKKVLSGEASALWSEKIFGGHPLFAESQFAFLSPLNVLVVGLFSPVFGQGLFHWLCILLTGAGMIALCNSLGLSLTATAFAACAVAFSGLWLDQQQNLAISGALVWVPWSFWAMELWLKKPKNFLPLSIIMVLSILAGYPQILHGTVIYLLLSMVSLVLSARERNGLSARWRGYLGYGLIAVILCVGLAAVQLLPLFELVGYSYRNADIQLLTIPVESMLRGMLYAPYIGDISLPYFWLQGSALVCVLASAVIMVRPGPRLLGHVFASFILLNLGLGEESWLFSFVYDHNLIPGIRSFRMSWPYFAPVVVGVALIAAFVIDGLQYVNFRRTRGQLCLALLIGFWCYAFYRLHIPQMPQLHYILLITVLLISAVLVFFRLQDQLRYLILAVLLIEIAFSKIDLLEFYETSLLEKPATVSFLESDADLENYRVHHLTNNGVYAFQSPHSKSIPKSMQSMMAAVTPSTNLLWDISGFGGAHALPQSRRMMIESIVNDELSMKSQGRAGLRFIDMLAIRYITVLELPPSEGMKLLFTDDTTGVRVVENTRARPRFQTYSTYQFVENPEEALELIQILDRPTLVVEQLDKKSLEEFVQTGIRTSGGGDSDMIFKLLKSTATEYLFSIETLEGGWFFVADANYPGWKAWLGEMEVPVYSAQILGKAVWIPAGKHTLKLQFNSLSFQYGLGISLLTLALMTFSLALYWCFRRYGLCQRLNLRI